jgi:hypothetical protein
VLGDFLVPKQKPRMGTGKPEFCALRNCLRRSAQGGLPESTMPADFANSPARFRIVMIAWLPANGTWMQSGGVLAAEIDDRDGFGHEPPPRWGSCIADLGFRGNARLAVKNIGKPNRLGNTQQIEKSTNANRVLEWLRKL